MSRKGKRILTATIPTKALCLVFGQLAGDRHLTLHVNYADDSDMLQICETSHAKRTTRDELGGFVNKLKLKDLVTPW